MSNSIIKKSVAITGAGSGLGLELAIGFAKKGYQVFGTAFSQAEIDAHLNQVEHLDIQFTISNITKEEEVKKWAAQVTSVTKNSGLDVLINNAGVLTPGPMEVLKLDAIRHEFEVNVFGSLSVINHFLPLLRTAKGRIVQISSGSGFFALPFSGPSSASKAAMESFADVYRIELKPFNVAFTVVRPGNMATGGPAKTARLLQEIANHMTAEEKVLYSKQFAQFAESFNKMQAGGITGTEAASKVIAIAEQTPAPIRATVGADVEELYQLSRRKSDEELDAIKMELFSLK